MGPRFETTRWSLVQGAALGSHSGAAALEELCRLYWAPVYALIRRRGQDAEKALDLTQEFFLELIEGQKLQHVDPSRGRFRSFLFASIQNFLNNQYRQQSALKRRTDHPTMTVSLDEAEASYAAVASISDDPARFFEHRWAVEVMSKALDRLESEFESAGNHQLYLALRPFLDGSAELSSAEVGQRLGMTEGAIRVALHRLRTRLGMVLKEVVSDTVLSDEELDDELRFLLQALSF